jgi:hypothetical protein
MITSRGSGLQYLLQAKVIFLDDLAILHLHLFIEENQAKYENRKSIIVMKTNVIRKKIIYKRKLT